jgi:signal transduction histidine kinase
MKEDRIGILIIEDEERVLQSLVNILGRRYQNVFSAENAAKALAIFKQEEIDLVITDIRMPGMDGLRMLQKMKHEKANIRRLVMSAYSEPEYFLQAIDLGVDGYIVKPFLKNKILEAVEKSVKAILNEKLIVESQEKLIASEKELREMNSTKDKFFSIIGHDVKTPIATIASYASLLEDEFEEMEKDEVFEMIKIIRKSSLRAIDLLKDLLEWAKVQSGNIAFHPEGINIQKIIEEEISFAHEQCSEKEIQIQHTPSHEQWAFADNKMVHTVFRNLLSNAIKFTPKKGFIKLSCNTVNKNGDQIQIKIQDNGVGIPKQVIPKLFSLAENYTTPGTKGEKGTGMGLIFCKEFTEIQGGKMEIESEEGKGSTFSFSLPLFKAE